MNVRMADATCRGRRGEVNAQLRATGMPSAPWRGNIMHLPAATVDLFCKPGRLLSNQGNGPVSRPSGRIAMRKTLLAAGAAAMLVIGPAMAQQKSVKIGFVSTFSGPTAAIGNDMRNAVELALDHLGRKMGGLPVEVIYEDDTLKPEVGKQKTEKLIESDKVDFVSGYIWSNVVYASYK